MLTIHSTYSIFMCYCVGCVFSTSNEHDDDDDDDDETISRSVTQTQ